MKVWNLDIILPLILDAGAMALKHPKRREPARKEDQSWVTPADVEIENFLKEGLKKLGAGFIGEESLSESASENPFTGLKFVIDPIDGTAPYINGLPTWGISIGLMKDGFFKDGILYLPAAETVIYTEGNEVWANGSVDFFIHPQEVYKKSVQITPRDAVPEYGMVAISQIIAKRGGYRGKRYVQASASSVWSLTQLAIGRLAGYISRGSLWDFAGAIPILSRLGFRAGLLGGGLKSLEKAEDLFLGYPTLGARQHIILAPTNEMVLEIERDSFLG